VPPSFPANDGEDAFSALPEQLFGRAQWLEKRGRIKDSELMYAAAAEIRERRRDAIRYSKATGASQ